MMQIGDLIIDTKHPEDGAALIIEIDLSKDEGYRLFCDRSVWWYDSRWCEKNCKVIGHADR